MWKRLQERRDITDLVWQWSDWNVLTGLPNRNQFRDKLTEAIRKARLANLPLALMIMDLDGFKHVNETLGHHLGDILLKNAAQRLNSRISEAHTIARPEGDEFAVILTDLHDHGKVNRVVGHILETLSEPFQLAGEITYASASIGISLYHVDGKENEELIKNAEMAMFAAKHAGRNQFHYFRQTMQDAAMTRMRLINDLRSALDDNQFDVVYQPIVELSSGSIHKAEALIRWQHLTKGLIHPDEFIPTAEDTGMITAFGDWFFHEAVKQAAQWRENINPTFQISVNVSPVQFKSEGIDSSVWFDHLKSADLPGEGIVVEITEGLLLDADTKITDQFRMLRDAGIGVSIDDFGTGYSSFSYLKKFNVEYLKIDKSFIRNLTSNSDDLALCEAIIVMAHKLDIKVIAEDVETEHQRDWLTVAECDYAQGYFFSEPLLEHELEKSIEANPFEGQKNLPI